jgi:xylulokinase
MGEIYLLGVDIGTYSSKGVLVRADGSVVASHTTPHGMEMPHPGWFEHDADQVWWRDFCLVTRTLLQKSGVDARQVACVGASAIGSCVLPIDESGKPLRPGILYGIDTRATAEIEFLERALGREAIFQRSAMHLSSQASGPKILWIREHEPEVYQQARWFLTSQAYLVYRLTGVSSIDVYTAGGYIPLYDVFKRKWVEEAAPWITPLERLPRAYWSAEVVGRVLAQAARQTGLVEGTPVVAGTTDAAAEALNAGMSQYGDMLVMFGSSIFFILKTTYLARAERFWSSNFLEEGTYAVLGGMSTAGSLTTWYRDQFALAEVEREKGGGENTYNALAASAAQSPIGAKGLVALPYFEGERTPLHDPQARGAWLGLSLKHTRADIYRAILEGVAYGIRHNLEAMAEEGFTARRILVSGGGAYNRLWLQIVADVCNIELVMPGLVAGSANNGSASYGGASYGGASYGGANFGGACYGDAFLAAVGCGLYPDLSEVTRWVEPKEIIRPDAHNHERYEGFYQVFRELYPGTKGLMHRLAQLDNLSVSSREVVNKSLKA